jgi:hypothetical protein
MHTLPQPATVEGEIQPRLPIEVELDEDNDFLFAMWEGETPTLEHLCTILPDKVVGEWMTGSEPKPQNPEKWRSSGWGGQGSLDEDLGTTETLIPNEDVVACSMVFSDAYLPRDMDVVYAMHDTRGRQEAFDIDTIPGPHEKVNGGNIAASTDTEILELLYPITQTSQTTTTRPWDYTADPRYGRIWNSTASGPDGHYHRDPSGRFLMIRNLYIVPEAARPLVMADIHKGYGHLALTTLIQMLTHWRLWWPELKKECAIFVQNCMTCNLKTITNGKVFGLLGRRPIMDKAQEIAVDFAQLAPVDRFNGVLGVIDRASRYTFWIPAANTWSARDCFLAIVNNWCRIFGWPLIIRSDNGPNLASNEWDQLWRAAGVQVSHSDPYHPQSNGIIERSFGTLKSRLRALYHENTNISWLDILPFQGCHNSTTRESLGGVSPAEVMLGFCPRWDRMPRPPSIPSNADWLVENDERMTKLSLSVTEAIRKHEAEMAQYENKSRIKWIPKKNELVFVSRRAFNFPDRDGLNMRYLGPVTVLDVIGDHSTTIMWEGAAKKVAVEYLRPCRIDPNAANTKSSLTALWQKIHPGQISNLDDQGVWDAPIFMDALDNEIGPSPTTPIAIPQQIPRIVISEPPVPIVDTDPISREIPIRNEETAPRVEVPPTGENEPTQIPLSREDTPIPMPTPGEERPSQKPSSKKSAPKKAQKKPNKIPPTGEVPVQQTGSQYLGTQSQVLDPSATWSPTKEIVKMEVQKGRTIFRTKWANRTKAQILHWTQLAHLDTSGKPYEWVVNSHLVTYFGSLLRENEETVLEKLDEGLLDGFLEEAMFDRRWYNQLIEYYPTFLRLKPLKTTVYRWDNTLEEARAHWEGEGKTDNAKGAPVPGRV